MAWKEVRVDKQRRAFIEAYLEEKFTMAELCRQFDISRPSGYKWIDRYKEEGYKGLTNRSSAPLNQAEATHPSLVREILAIKFRWPKWGPKKVRGHLIVNKPTIIWPSTTTIGNILDRHGLVTSRKYRKRLPEKTDPLSHANKSNDVWSVDFKGWWITKDGHKYEPFTLTDNYSRFLLKCLKLKINNGDHAWAVFDAAFREFGLPNFLRHDNGPPFATSGVGRLSALSVKLIKAGVMPEWIEPGNPQQNGRHERMHGTMQQEGVFSELDLLGQQKQLSIFQDYYNFERPHEALGQVTPGSVYRPFLREWNGRLISPEYPKDYKIGRVKSCGKMSWRGHEIYVGRVLAGELVGLRTTEEGLLKR
jgi:transposase InsO family protein